MEINNTNKYSTITKKLNDREFSYKIGYESCTNGEVTYYLENGKLSLEISALDSNNKETSLTFMVGKSIEELNNFKNEPICINDYIVSNETYYFNESLDRKVNIDNDFEFSMIEQVPSYYVQKIDDYKFVFRVDIPSKLLFTYFLCDLND